ncbi:bifunctional hydroxymethylpyrimidine kinase/phosphomethylpyrimidine kinase [Allosphingosinicella flava]|uniref:hydroxymethylpyrimidine kinase n=1 Tax=Allosphingosinicella flava TaxID=2771430 RepID=A0A7T2GJQ8_9SPHN|nr:bifunctional hydroxymethylpyrimidine kinase/phosphomethylpyrimidine kinase [Sphingosinicella flava]QPQ55137.1 bifunctional hydroxymethylpyrimidine kinase/phosphomethylpyrimidine kinase [Sphingosinicella flava]
MTARILIIAGSDSGGGAGIQADIKTVTMMGGHAMTAVTALTAQNTLGVEGVLPISADFVLQQMDMVVSDIGVDAVKIGMIGAPDTAERVTERLAALSGTSIVFDPVMVASSGAALADKATITAFRKLLGIATIVTPNAPELGILTGRAVTSAEEAEEAGKALAAEWNVAVLAKGGHIDGPVLRDTLIEADGIRTHWESARVDTRNTHGTGCTLASAIATGLGQGRPLVEAVARARDYLQRAIAAAPGFGAGHGPLGHALGVIPYERADATN